MTIVAGVDIGNATTEVAVVEAGRLIAVERVPTRGRKGSADSLRGAAAVLRRIERRTGIRVERARMAPLRPVDTATLAIPPARPRTGRLAVIAAGVATPGGSGSCVGTPIWLDHPVPAGPVTPQDARWPGDRREPVSGATGQVIALVPAGYGFARAAQRVRALIAARVPVTAVLTAGDEGVLIANRLGTPIPVIDQVDMVSAAACVLVAVEVRPPGQPLRLLADPVALTAAFALDERDAPHAATLGRALLDYSNAVVGLRAADSAPGRGSAGAAAPGEPWVVAGGARLSLPTACIQAAGWPVGTVSELGTPHGTSAVDDLFAVDLGAVTDAATARRGSVGRSALIASLHRLSPGTDHAAALADLAGCPVVQVLSEPAAARIGALTTPGAAPDALVVDVGAGTIDVIAPAARHGRGQPRDTEVVAAGAGDLLSAAVAETLGIPRAAADWVKRGPCLRVEGGQRYEAEDGRRGFLGRPPPAGAVGMLAVTGPAGLLPFDSGHSPGEWRAIRLRIKQAVFAVNLRRALRTLGAASRQVIIVGGPADDDELLGVLMRDLPEDVAAGRGNVGGTLAGGEGAVGCRYAAALGLALADD